MTQNFANNAATTLSASMTNVATSCSVASASTLPAVPFIGQVDSELLNVTAVVGTTLTVQRGQEGTTAASHSSGAAFTAPVTAGGLQNLIRLAHIGSATPSGGSSGDMKVGTGFLWVKDGTTWKSVALSAPIVGKFVSLSGSDSTGDGSIGNPWRTMQKFVDSAPAAGATCYVRGGNYPYVNERNPGFMNARDTWPSLIGTPTAPITIRNYPGEDVTIDAATAPIMQLGPNETSNTIGTNYVVIEGFKFTNSVISDEATIVFGGYEPTLYLTKNITIRNCFLSLGSGRTQNDHNIGIIHGTDGVVVEGCTSVGTSIGGSGVVVYSQPAALNVIIRNNAFINHGNIASPAIQIYDYDTAAPDATGQILHNTFKGNESSRVVDLRYHSTFVFRDNAFDNSSEANALYDPGFSGSTTKDHNFYGQTIGPSPDYALTAGSGIGAASDGTNAGWAGG